MTLQLDRFDNGSLPVNKNRKDVGEPYLDAGFWWRFKGT